MRTINVNYFKTGEFRNDCQEYYAMRQLWYCAVFWIIGIRLVLFYLTARCYAERGYATVSRLSLSVRLSVRLSLTFKYVFHTGWNTSKIISQPNSLRHLLTMTPTWAIWRNGNTPKIRVE